MRLGRKRNSLLPSWRATFSAEVGWRAADPSIQGEGVGQATYAIAPLDTPLATRGLASCRALVVQDEQAGLHYVAHVDDAVTAEQIKSSLTGLNLEKSNLYVLRGDSDSSTTAEIIGALRDNPQALSRLKFISPELGAADIGLISYRGRILNITRDVKEWPTFHTGQPSAAERAALSGSPL